MIHFDLFIATVLALLVVAHSLATPSKPSDSIRTANCVVWDNVLNEATANRLHHLSKEKGSIHNVFSRNRTAHELNEMEVVLDSILTQLSDNSTYVEYWTRLEWKSIEAHADVDERLAKDSDASGTVPYRYPTSGHVLYLNVGTHVRGPTCVFPGRRSGGDLVRHAVQLVTVPAVEGRLLRFQGDTLHAVPRPHNFWMLPFVRGAPQQTPEEMWGRSVILFNTWGDAPPQDIPLDVEHFFGGVADDEQDRERHQQWHRSNEYSLWSKAFHHESDDPSCDAQQVPTDEDGEEMVNAKIWLLGNERRREHTMRTIKMKAPSNLESALGQTHEVNRLLLQQL